MEDVSIEAILQDRHVVVCVCFLFFCGSGLDRLSSIYQHKAVEVSSTRPGITLPLLQKLCHPSSLSFRTGSELKLFSLPTYHFCDSSCVIKAPLCLCATADTSAHLRADLHTPPALSLSLSLSLSPPPWLNCAAWQKALLASKQQLKWKWPCQIQQHIFPFVGIIIAILVAWRCSARWAEEDDGGGKWRERKDHRSVRLATATIEISVKLACIAAPRPRAFTGANLFLPIIPWKQLSGFETCCHREALGPGSVPSQRHRVFNWAPGSSDHWESWFFTAVFNRTTRTWSGSQQVVLWKPRGPDYRRVSVWNMSDRAAFIQSFGSGLKSFGPSPKLEDKSKSLSDVTGPLVSQNFDSLLIVINDIIDWYNEPVQKVWKWIEL